MAPLGASVPIDVQSPALLDYGAEGSAGPGSSRFWARAEFLYWRIKDGNAPPLVTAGTPDSLGILGNPGTTTLFGDGLNYGARPGARFTLGTWLDCGHSTGIELGYFFLGGGANGFGASSSGADGSAVLARPFFNVNTGLPDVQLIAFPGVVPGSVRISSNSRLQGADLNLLFNHGCPPVCCQPVCCEPVCCQPVCSPTDCCKPEWCQPEYFRKSTYRLDLFAGPRWLQLNEDLVIAEQVNDPMATFMVVDRFETRNNFYGGQIGARAEWQRGRCFANVLGKVALGTTHQEVRISGTTVITEPGAAPNVQQGGLLALPTNIGSYSRNVFSVVPEIGVNVGYQVTDRLRVFGGYSFLYWSNVVRPGDQIDLGVNPTQLPSAAGPGRLVGQARPTPLFRDTDFWAHGINVGLELNW